MERQCFENETIAEEMNRLFVNVKVDREERPDVDQLYMTAVQVLTRHGGWPMSVWLTPDLRPFYGGTYFPPANFMSYLRALEDAYRNRHDEVEKTATQITSILGRLANPGAPDKPLTVNSELIESLVQRSVADYDAQNGGFGGAPKFPRQTVLELLLVYLDSQGQSAGPKPRIEPMLRHALDAMADGGIRDQLGGGFHRYSTDAKWLVPHFEIMLYDNAMLGWIYAEAFRQFNEARYARIARGIFDFVLREMTSPDGAFYTAFDAEVDAQEGLSYLWTSPEIESLLGAQDAKLFNRVYGVDLGPNFVDPHHGSGTPDKSILHLPRPISALAADLKIDPDQLEAKLATLRQTLYEARRRRKQPLLDTKVITSWNALTIRALAHGGSVLGEKSYVNAASRAADYLLRRHLKDGTLARTSRDGTSKHRGFLDDYAYLAQAMLAVHEATGVQSWKQHAASLAVSMIQKFVDEEGGGFFFTDPQATDIIVRQKTAQDSPLPSGNAVAAMVLLALGQPRGALSTLAAFAQQMADQGESMSSMVEAALVYLGQAEPFTVSASPSGS
ncbi:MAG TPA: thioredoxin domain-containing protein, partial [Tepidisphaeraceae bacterium]|nr:thioredoxin domain-containing protein [Tepidisphaeraceae bacterium]